MALQTSGAISLNDMHIEVGGTSGTQVSLNDTDIRGLISKASGAQSSFSEFYGAANVYIPTSAATINGQSNLKEITISSYISSGETFEVPSNFWIWSDNRATPAMTIDIPCTIINKGKVIGKGGQQEEIGGPAIKINSGVTGVTIQNNSGAYIAGGGGGGASQGGGGGGGAGGGGATGQGGVLNASGSAGYNNNNGRGAGGGGGAGGAGGGTEGQPFVSQTGAQGGGGGRILPGTGGIAYTSIMAPGGNGGSAGNNGSNGTATQAAIDGGGGGGGWGANGGNIGGQYARSGKAGGAAIDDSGQTYTLTNNGTIYGST